MYRRYFLFGSLLAGAGGVTGAAIAAPKARKKVFIVSQTGGFRHSSIQTACDTVKMLGDKSGSWEVVGRADSADEVAASITADKLRGIDLVFFANTTGTLNFTPAGKTAFYDWLYHDGGNYAGVHSAGDTFHGDPAYLDLVRGEFVTHGPQMTVTAVVQDPDHPACAGLPASFQVHDEIYEYINWERKKVHVLLTMHKHPQKDLRGDFPIAWTNRYGKARMFYTSLGHREDMYANPLYHRHLTGGMEWALGLKKGDDTRGNPLI